VVKAIKLALKGIGLDRSEAESHEIRRCTCKNRAGSVEGEPVERTRKIGELSWEERNKFFLKRIEVVAESHKGRASESKFLSSVS